MFNSMREANFVLLTSSWWVYIIIFTISDSKRAQSIFSSLFYLQQKNKNVASVYVQREFLFVTKIHTISFI